MKRFTQRNKQHQLLNNSSQYILGIALTILLWKVLTSELFLPATLSRGIAPIPTLTALLSFLSGEEFLRHTVPSLKRAGVGLGVALLCGFPLGLAIGRFHEIDRLTVIPFQFIRMTSPLAWMPLAIMVFGIGNKPIYFLISIAATWPIMLNTAQGVRTTERIWIDVVRSLGGSNWQVLLRAILPATLPHTVTGIRVALGICWVVLVPAEMLGVSAGLGYYILDARDRFNYSELLAVVIVIGIIGLLCDTSIKTIESRIHRHRRCD